IEALAPAIRGTAITAVPWKHEWCYITPLWRELGVRMVADLAPAASDLARARGVGRVKLLALARELVFLSPELYAAVRAPIAPARRTEQSHAHLGPAHREL